MIKHLMSKQRIILMRCLGDADADRVKAELHARL